MWLHSPPQAHRELSCDYKRPPFKWTQPIGHKAWQVDCNFVWIRRNTLFSGCIEPWDREFILAMEHVKPLLCPLDLCAVNSLYNCTVVAQDSWVTVFTHLPFPAHFLLVVSKSYSPQFYSCFSFSFSLVRSGEISSLPSLLLSLITLFSSCLLTKQWQWLCLILCLI